MSIQDCLDLVGWWLEMKYPTSGLQLYAVVPQYPEVILESETMELWAQSLVGHDVEVNMRSPRTRRFLKDLAEKGVGYTADFREVRYKICAGMSLTATPVMPSAARRADMC